MEFLDSSVQFVGVDGIAPTSTAEPLPDNGFRGLASVFGSVVDAFIPTIIHRGSFVKTLRENQRGVKILFMHDMDRPIGKPTSLFEGDSGLDLTAQVSRTPSGIEAMTLIRDGVIDALSIGFDAVKFDFEEIEGVQFRHIREVRLFEISPVTLGADALARINEVNSTCDANVIERFGLLTAGRIIEDDESKGKRFAAEVLRYSREGNLDRDRLVSLTESFGYIAPITAFSTLPDENVDVASDSEQPITHDVERLYDDAMLRRAALLLDE